MTTVLAGFTVTHVDVGPLELSRILEPRGAVVVLVVMATTVVLLGRCYLPFAIWSPIYGFVGVYLVLSSAGYAYYMSNNLYLSPTTHMRSCGTRPECARLRIGGKAA